MTQPIYADIGASVNNGYNIGRQRLSTQLAGQAINAQGDDRQAAMSQLASVDPNDAMQLGGQFQQQAQQAQAAQQTQDATQSKKVNGAANFMLQAIQTKDPNQIQGAWQSVKPYLEQLTGKSAPDQYDPSMLPGIYQAAGQSGGVPTPKTNVLSAGASLTDATGNVLYHNDVSAKPQLIQTANGGYVWATPGGSAAPLTYGGGQQAPQGQQAQPQPQQAPPQAGGSQDPMNAILAQANQMAQSGTPDAQVQQFIMQQAQHQGIQMGPPGQGQSQPQPVGTPPPSQAGDLPAMTVSPDASQPAQDEPQAAAQTTPAAGMGTQPGAPVMGPQKAVAGGALEQKLALARSMGATPEQLKSLVLGNTGQNAPETPPPGDPTLTGDAYLQTIPQGMRGIVKAIANGDQNPPSSSSRSPMAQALLQAVYTYDPSANAGNLSTRTATRKSFTSGKDAQNMTALSQLALHLDHLNDQVGSISGSPVLPNGLINTVEDRFNGNTTAFDSSANAVAHELRSVFANANGGTQAELDENLKQLNSSNSTEQKEAAVRNIAQLVHGRFQILQDKYSQGMGKAQDPFNAKYPGTEPIIARLAGSAQQSQAAAQPQAQPQQAQQPAQPQSQPPPAAVSMLRGNPQLRAAFDEKYGQGASASVLGQ